MFAMSAGKKFFKEFFVVPAVFLFAFLVAAMPVNAASTADVPFEVGAGAIETLESIKKIDKDFYTMEYFGDYFLEELMEKGVEDPEALNSFISEKLMGGLPFAVPQITLACSTFFSQNTEGDHVLARNMDLSYAKNFLVRTKPKNGYESLSMSSGHMMGYTDKFPDSKLGRLWTLAAPYFAIDGINEKGLSVAILLVADKPVRQKTGNPPFTTTLAVRYILDNAATVDEAIEIMKKHDMRSMANTNFHHHITDAQGNSAVVEYVENKMRVIRPTGYGHPVTNYYLTPWMKYVVIDGQDRMEILEAALNETQGVVSTDKAWKMLESVKAVNDYDEKSGIDFWTAYSILYNNTKRTMDVCLDAKFDKIYSFKIDE